jgi:hypothetical protein
MRTTSALVVLFILVLTIGLLFSGCSPNEGSPSNVVKRYITAVYNEDESAGDELALAFFGNYTENDIIAITRKDIDKKKLIRIKENNDYNSGTEAFVLADFDDGSYLIFTLVRDKGRWKIGGIR